MRYKIVTFRGYEYEADVTEAIEKALQRLEEIQGDFANDNTIWWVRIEDTEKGLFKLLTSIDFGQTSFTHWIK